MSVDHEVGHGSLAVVRATMGHDRGVCELREADRAGVDQDRLGSDIAVGDTCRGNPNSACGWSECTDNDIVHTDCGRTLCTLKRVVAYKN